ncbi:MAG: signal peptide peptidase SppA, partial [Alphaproteobacteria bacterium]|nr:signal peptide peptidase SppA [Alphaproteobacteria bacterium]
WRLLSYQAPAKEAPEAMILTLDLNKSIVEKEGISPFSMAFNLDAETTPIFTIVRALERAKKDDRVKAVVARFGSAQPGFAHAQEIRSSLLKFVQAGKPSYAFAPSYGDFGGGNRSYYLASVCKEIWLQPVGAVGLMGVGIEVPFGKTALSKIGVSGDFMQREEYKSAMEGFTRDEFSQPAKANIEEMLKDLSNQLALGIAENRNWDLGAVNDLIAHGPYTAEEALKNKLVTRLGYEDELLLEVEAKAGKDAQQVDAETYLDLIDSDTPAKAKVALITGDGLIADVPNGSRSFADNEVMDSNELAEAFGDAVKDSEVKAIIFRINSPGGSPVASETIRHALVRAKEANKPVFVSMGEVAASGGYWVAMNADYIAALPSTLTGSIGVVAGKFVAGELWNKLGIKWDTLSTGGNSRMWSSLAPFDDMGRERMNALMDDTYKTFVSNVSSARKIPLDKMPDVAKGRVWTGERALKMGLVDELGGLSTTVLAVKKKLDLAPDDPIELQQFPVAPSPAEFVLKMLKNMGAYGVEFNNILGGVRVITSRIAPFVNDVTTMTPVAARLPRSVAGAVE